MAAWIDGGDTYRGENLKHSRRMVERINTNVEKESDDGGCDNGV